MIASPLERQNAPSPEAPVLALSREVMLRLKICHSLADETLMPLRQRQFTKEADHPACMSQIGDIGCDFIERSDAKLQS